eukprot:GEMP01014984.1.p1 GENE.GEMP01014984.1~~GEMP01014984.1.p1  ORF type:complete len:114 (-),score=10.87 GEMP01014984.1:85-426(-)
MCCTSHFFPISSQLWYCMLSFFIVSLLSFGCVGLCTAVRPWQTLYLFGLMPVPLLVAVGASILGEVPFLGGGSWIIWQNWSRPFVRPTQHARFFVGVDLFNSNGCLLEAGQNI